MRGCSEISGRDKSCAPAAAGRQGLQSRAVCGVADTYTDAIDLDAAAIDGAGYVIGRAAAVDVVPVGDHQQDPVAAFTGDAIQVSGCEAYCIQQCRARLRLDGFEGIAEIFVIRGEVLLENQIVAK